MSNFTNDWERLKNPDPDNVFVTFVENEKHYVFSHSRSGCEWHLAELPGPLSGPLSGLTAATAQNLMPTVLRSGRWQRYYEVLVPFTKGGRNYLFAHSSHDKRWFISDLSAAWDGNSERKSGHWARFYAVASAFAENGHNYLLAHSSHDKRWFISDLSTTWDGSSEIKSGSWSIFCDSMLVFVRGGQNYVFVHASVNNSWSIARLGRDWNGYSTVKSGNAALRDMAALPEF